MKKIDLLGLSVVTAALIMTGCSSDSDDAATSGPTAPTDVTAKIDVNLTTTQNAIALVTNGIGLFSNAKIAAMKADVKAKALALKDSGGNGGSWSFDCQVSGTRANSWESTWSNNPDGSWSNTYSETYTAKNCEDNASTTVNGEAVNLYKENGTRTYTNSDEYDAGGDLTTSSYSSADNFTHSCEHNETLTSRTYKTTVSLSNSFSVDGIVPLLSADAPAFSQSTQIVGTSGDVDVNSTGSTIAGWEDAYNISMSQEGLQDGTYDKDSANGFAANYDINATGDKVLFYSDSYSNYVEEHTSDGANESNTTISGTRGNTCLGGSATFATTLIIQENQVDYLDGNDNPGNNVLPYSGVVTLSAVGTATLTFDNNTTHSDANLTAGDESAVYTRWLALSVGTCALQ